MGRGMALSRGMVSVMMRNIPRLCTADDILMEMGECFALEDCCLLHLPWDTKRRSNIGFAFITFSHAEAAEECFRAMSGRSWTVARGKPKKCRIVPASLQGVAAQLQKYVLTAEESWLFHPPYAPLVFSEGKRIGLSEAIQLYVDPPIRDVLLWRYHAKLPGCPGDTLPSVVRRVDSAKMQLLFADLDPGTASTAASSWSTADLSLCPSTVVRKAGASTPPCVRRRLSPCPPLALEAGHDIELFL